MGVSKHYSLEFGLILDAVSIGVYTYHYHRTAEVVDLPAGHGFHQMRLFTFFGRFDFFGFPNL